MAQQRRVVAVFGEQGAGKTFLCSQLGLGELTNVTQLGLDDAANMRSIELALSEEDDDFAVSSNNLNGIAQQVEAVRNCVVAAQDDQADVQLQVVVCCRQDQGVVGDQLANQLPFQLADLAQDVTVLQARLENNGNRTWRVFASTRSPEMNNTVVESAAEVTGLQGGEPQNA